MSGPALAPLPPSFGVQPLPGTVLAGRVVEGGTPLRRVQLTALAAAVTEALFAGSSVAGAAERAGCSVDAAGSVGRRLVATAIGGPTAARCAGPDRPALGDVVAVIPAHDSARTIRGAIAGLTGVGKVIVVDDGSRDRTAEVATAAGAHVIRNDRPTGPAAARNRGIAATSTEIVVVLDSDVEPEPGWLDLLLDHFVDPQVGGVAPRVVSIDDGSALGRYEAASSPLDLGAWPAVVRPDGPVTHVSTSALALRRAVWERLGGFTESLRFGEDLDFAWRTAYDRPLVYEPGAVVGHHHRSTLGAHLENRRAYGSAAGPLSRRHDEHPRVAVAPPALAAAAVAAVGGFPRAAAVLAGTSAGLTVGDLLALGETPAAAVRDSVRSTLRSSRGLMAAVSRPWLPAALLLGTLHRRSRPAVAATVSARLLSRRRRDARDVPAVQWTALHVLEDLAFSTGVFQGCLTSRTVRPLTVRSPAAPVRDETVLGTELLLS